MGSSAQKSSGAVQAPSQVQQESGEGSEGSQEALVQSQVTFNKVPEKIPENVWEALA